MDKYTYNIKAEKIQKLVKKGEYEAAVKIAETVDWEEVHSVRLLTITAAAYERIRDYKGAIELLQMAYDESAVGKRILYKLTGLAIADKDVELAQRYYEMYLQEAPDDNGRYLLRYLLAELKGESLDKRIAILETYRKYEFEEEWALRLAELYDEAGMGDACVRLCDEIILWFGVGDYVDEALKLKAKYAPLSAQQQDKIDNREFYEQRYQEVAAEFREKDEVAEEPEEEPEDSDEESEEESDEDAEEKASADDDDEDDDGDEEDDDDDEDEDDDDDDDDDDEESPAVILPDDDAWQERIVLVEGDTLEKAVPKVLAALNRYHEKYHTPMTGLTRIPALKFNKLGLAASRPHIAEKDLLVDGASVLSDDLLDEIIRYVKEEGTTTVFALTDTPTELAYLDARLGSFLKEELPAISESVTEADEEALKLDLDEPEEEKLTPDLAGDTKEIVPQVKAALGEAEEPVLDERAAVSDTVKFDKGVVAEETAELHSAASVILPENDDDYRQETIEDFFKAQEEAAKPTQEEVKSLQEAATPVLEETKPLQEAATPVPEETKPLQEAATPVLEEAETPGEVTAETRESLEEAEEATEDSQGAFALPEEELGAETVAISVAAEALRKEAEAIEEGAAEEAGIILEEDETQPREIEEELPVLKIEEEPEEESEEESEEDERQEMLRQKAAKIAGSMSPESFVIYAKNYLTSIDCVLQEDGEEALMAAAEDRLEEGTALTKEEAENIIEAAADLSEKKGGLFSRRYNKDGCLILKSKYIV